MALEVLSIVVTPVTEVGKCLVRKLKTEFDYVTKYNSYLSNFREELLQLQKKRNDVDKDVEKARRESKEPREEVLGWVERVEELEKKYMKLTTNNRTNNKCLMGLRCSRRRKSKQLLKLTNDINSLQEKGSFTDIAHMPPSLSVVPMGPRGTVENIPSRELIKNEVMKALEDDNIRSIGVHGMGGIGKTTLVNSINNGLRETRKKVIMVTVSKDPDMKIIQSRIAERLDLKLDKEDMPTRANALLKRLRSEESVLIILDDVWKPMELSEIGLGQSTKDMPCKLIVTTRNANVCSGMEVEKVIKMNILPEDEAWILFEAKAGNVIVEMPSLEPTAREIVRRCKGSPLAIATLGSTLRTKEVHSWAYALQVLKKPNAMGLDDIMDKVVKSLRLSYDHLKPNVQQCFLYCCLFPEDYNISLTDLRNYGIGDGFLKMTSSLKEAQNELLHYVQILKDCCLLLDGYDKSSVKMHDVVRDVAIWIASNDEDGNGFLVNVGEGSNCLSESVKLLTYKRISFMDNKDILFPNSLECPQLRSLLVRGSDSETKYSFEGVKSLLVLDMSWQWRRVSVPESIPQLRNLRTLYLDGCHLLDKTYLLGGLTKLEVLSMRGSKIGELSVDFGNLTNLKFLDLTDAVIDFVPPNVFSRLLKLEELLIAGSIKGWDTTGELKDDVHYGRWCIRDDGSRRYAELKEVLSLPPLSVLDIVINRPLLDGEVLNYHNLQNFRIYVDYNADMHSEDINSFHFSCDANSLYIGRTNLGKHWIRNLIAVSNKNLDLILEGCGGFKSVTDLDPAESFNHLQCLTLDQCDDVESVVVADRSTITAQDSFEKLEILALLGMDKMERILHGATSSTKFFGKLEGLVVSQCSKICTIFPCNLLFTDKRLENLEYVGVYGCDEVQHIFNAEDNEFGATPATTALLCGITGIELGGLPKLKSIWKGIMPERSFQGLTELSVVGCRSLKHLLPSDVAGLLQNLEKIKIDECDAMETIICPIGEEAEETSLFPRCKFLTVASCSNLKSIWKGITPEGSFQGLTYLSVKRCHSLKHLFPSDVAGLLQNLEEIKIKDCAALETIIFPTREEAEGTSLLPMCRLLTVDSCPKLKSVFSFGIARHLHKLNKLSISHCHGLRQIFGNGDEPRVTEHRCLLPELNYLELVDLRSLTRFDQDNLPISGPLEEIKVFVCPNLTRLPLQTVSALKFIHAEHRWFRNLELKDESQASILKPHFQATSVHHFRGINEKLRSLVWKVAGLWLDDYDSQLEGTTQFRWFLFRGYLDDMPIEDVSKSGVVPCLVEFLAREDHMQLQSEAAWVLADIASRSSDHTKLVIDHGALPIFVKLLCSPNEYIREQAIWALGKIARVSPEYRDLVLRHGGLIHLLAQLNDCAKVSILKNAVGTISNLFVVEPQPPFEQMKLVLLALTRRLDSNNEIVCTCACLDLLCRLPGTIYKTQAITETRLFPQLLKHPHPLVLKWALYTVDKDVYGDHGQTQYVITHQALPCLLDLLTHHEDSIKKDACHVISNITAGNKERIQLVIAANIFAPLVHLLEVAELAIKREAARAISNATFSGSQEQMKHLVEQGSIKPFCDLLQCSDSDIVVLCLKGLFNILKVGETGGLGVLNRYVEVIDGSGGFENIAYLQGHENREIQQNAVDILKSFQLEKYRPFAGDATVASFHSGGSKSNGVEKETISSKHKQINLKYPPSSSIELAKEHNVETRLFPQLLKHPHPLVLKRALYTLDKDVYGDHGQTQYVITRQALPCLLDLLTHHEDSIKKAACRVIATITAGNKERIQLVIAASIFAPLVHLLEVAELAIKREAARAISNATFSSSQEQIKHLVEQGSLKPFCDLLQCSDSDIVGFCLKGLFNILKVGETGGLGVLKRYVEIILDSGGFQNIENLQGHDNIEIQRKAVEMLKSFQLEKYRPFAGDATVASFHSGGSKSNDVEKETISSKHKQVDLNNPPLSPYVRDSSSHASVEQYTFKVGPGTNNNRPLLRPKPTNKNVSNIGLVRKEKQVIVCKDYGMTRADDPSCMTLLGNAKINLKYPPSSSIELAKEHHVDQIPDEEPYVRDFTSNASVKIDDNSSQLSSTELAKQSHVIHTPKQELQYKETWKNIFMKLGFNSLSLTSAELEHERYVSQMPKQDNHESDCTVWDSNQNVVMGESTSTATSSMHDEAWNDQSKHEHEDSTGLEVVESCTRQESSSDYTTMQSMKTLDATEMNICALGKIARDSPKHRDLVLQHIEHLQGHDNSEIQQKDVDIIKSFQLEKHTPSVGDSTLVSFQFGESESSYVEEETISSTEIENPTSRCKQIDLNNLPLSPYVRDSWSKASVKEYKIDLKYPPSSSIEIANERHIDEMPDKEPYGQDIKDSMKLDLNSLPSSSTKLEKEGHISQMPEEDNHESDSTVWDSSQNVFMGESTPIATTSTHDDVWSD